jgi:hypothetical protein
MDPLRELTKIQNLAAAANLSEDGQRGLTWCLKRLPVLYKQLLASDESRFHDEIQRLVQGTVKTLAEKSSPDGSRLAQAMILSLHSLHERVGIAVLNVRSETVARERTSRRAG